MANIAVKFFSTKYMLKPQQIIGQLPSSKEAYKNNLNLAMPSAIEGVLISLISAVDTIMVGGIGPAAIAAVGLTVQPKMLVLTAILSLNIGVTSLSARRKGEGDILGANRCLKQSIIISAAISFLLNFLAYMFSSNIMNFMGANAETHLLSEGYFKIILIGNFFYSIGLTINAAQKGTGNTKISMKTNVLANLINLLFNYLLINGIWIFPRLGVIGAAIATAMGNIAAFIMSVASICHPNGFLNIRSDKNWKFDRTTLSGIARIGTSSFADQAFMRFGLISFARIVANLGTKAFAANQICMNILNISFAYGDGMSVSASALSGQNLGAKRPDLSRLYTKVGQRITLVFATFLFIMFFFGRHFIIELFTNDAEVIAMGADLIIIIAFTCYFQSSNLVFAGCLRGAGDTVYVAMMSLISVAILRPFTSWFFCYPCNLGLLGAWFGVLIDQVSRVFFTYSRFKTNKWTNIKL